MRLETNDIENVGQNIISLANEYEVLITKLFKRLNDMPYTTKEWIGNEAQQYIQLVLMNKEEFVEFGNELKSFGIEIAQSASKINSLMNSLK